MIVPVRTVVVTSGTPRLRTTALRIPIATAVSTISAYAIEGGVKRIEQVRAERIGVADGRRLRPLEVSGRRSGQQIVAGS